MKKTAFILLIVCLSIKTFSQSNFTLSGKIDGAINAYARLTYVNNDGKWSTDSCTLQNGMFTFKGNVNGVGSSTLIVYTAPYQPENNYDANSARIFLEQGYITATGAYGHLNNLKVNGSKSNEEYLALHLRLDKMNKELEPVSNHFNQLTKEINIAKKQNKGDKIIDSLKNEQTLVRKQIEPFANKYEGIIHKFVFTHPNSFISPIEMGPYISSWPLDSVKLIYNKFSPPVQNSLPGKRIQKAITDIMNNSANKLAKNFITKDVNGKPISLSDFKGKYVLLDFWGSWCIPCREGMPHTIQVFKKYNALGFEFIAIADDNTTQDDWKRAIKKDKTGIWHNVLSGGRSPDGTNPNSITDKFGISIYPTKILIDKNGMILGRYDETETVALDKKLAKLFRGKN